jgi:hypothetical protein
MAKKVLSIEEEKELAYLKASNEMFLKSIDEAKLRGTKEAVSRLEMARQDVIAQMAKISPSEAKKADKLQLDEDLTIGGVSPVALSDTLSIYEVLERYNTEEEVETVDTKEEIEEKPLYIDPIQPIQQDMSMFSFNHIDSDIQYDIINLPSHGQCYRHKMDRLPVGYLTAFDENLITSPNLYKDGLIIDFLLKHKVLEKNINLDELCSGDVDAIILFLRATSYGVEFPITARDPQTGEEIESVVDLSTLKYKEFTLVGDENGYFDFELPVSKDKIKFRFLTRKDEKMLRILSEIETHGVKAQMIRENVKLLGEAVKTDSLLDGKTKQDYLNALTKLVDWAKKLEAKSSNPYSKVITNRMEMSIVSVNGNADRKYIAKYVHNMGAKDALMLRRYILENEPGVNFEIEVERPASLGGGSFKTFLDWDDSVFLNIA